MYADILRSVNLCLLVTSGKPDWDLAAECTSECGHSILKTCIRIQTAHMSQMKEDWHVAT